MPFLFLPTIIEFAFQAVGHARTIELPAGIIGDEPGGNEESQA